jgi:hypothetical protein
MYDDSILGICIDPSKKKDLISSHNILNSSLFSPWMSCWILKGRLTTGAQMNGIKVSDSLSDVACSLSQCWQDPTPCQALIRIKSDSL